jgi:hypothetical protein
VCWSTVPGEDDAEGRRAAVDDFIATLGRLNRELNGEMPSASTSGVQAMVPASVAYAVAEVARMLREYPDSRNAWRVETAWLAVLAGDIDDVETHVDDEYRTRGLDL